MQQYHSCGTQIPVEARYSRDAFRCPGCGQIVSPQASSSAIFQTEEPYSDVREQPFPSMNYYGVPSYEERNPYSYNQYEQSFEERSPYSYNQYEQSLSSMQMPQQAMREPRRGIRHVWMFVGGLIVQVTYIAWVILISLPGSDGDSLYPSNPLLEGLSVLLFMFVAILLVTLVSISLVSLARLKRWGWFVGMLLGSIGGVATIFFPGVALIVCGLLAPRTPRASLKWA